MIECLTRLSVHQLLNHQLGVVETAGQLLAAAKLLQQRQLVGAELPLLVDVGDGAHERTQDELGVVLTNKQANGLAMSERTREPRRSGSISRPHLEEVDLHGAVGEVQHDGALGSEPDGQVRQPRQLVALPPRDVGARLQQVLAHVVAEVLEQRDLCEEGERCVGIHRRPTSRPTAASMFNQNASAENPFLPLGTDLLVEARGVRAHVQVRFSGRLVDVLQAVAVGVHDEARVVVEKHADAVVAQLVA